MRKRQTHKAKDLSQMIDEMLYLYLQPDILPDKDKIDVLKTAIDWVKVKVKTEEGQMGNFFAEPDELTSLEDEEL